MARPDDHRCGSGAAEPSPLPRMIPIQRRFDAPTLDHPEAVLCAQWRQNGLLSRVRPGHRVAIAVGSRGICGIARLVRALAQLLAEAGALPFVVPAMGSHGGGTATGQAAILEHLGITAASTGVPIRSSMQVCQIGAIDGGHPVYMDRQAWEAEPLLWVFRLKCIPATLPAFRWRLI